MRNSIRTGSSLAAAIILLGLVIPTFAGQLAGYGHLSGNVSGSKPGVLPTVVARHIEKEVSFVVFVVNGEYTAVNLIPGNYDVTIRPAVDQLEGFTPETVRVEIAADTHTNIDFALRDVRLVPNYSGGMPYPDGTTIRPYDEIYPPGPGRDILERVCYGCHTQQLFPYNGRMAMYSGGRPPHDKAGWAATVNRMIGRMWGKSTLVDPELLPPKDREVLIDYLAENFGADSEPRLVELSSEPELNLDALAKAMFVEFRFPNKPDYKPRWPWPHQVDFDLDGNAWLAHTSCCIIRIDPRTADSKIFYGQGGGHGIAVDQTDGTVWYSGNPPTRVVSHLDPETGLVDHWKVDAKRIGSNTQIFDSKGDLWLSLMTDLGKWDRETNSIKYWEVPVLRSRSYGIVVDYNDVVWFADYHSGGVTSFNSETETFRHYPLVPHLDKASNSIRRLGVDSNNNIWAPTWGSWGTQNAAVYQLNPETGAVQEHKLGIEYSNPYSAEGDENNNVWVAADNYISMFDQTAQKFVHYPIPVRSDTVKTTIAANGGIWFQYRNAGKYAGYGGTAVVLYPDKDKLTTMASYPAEWSNNYALGKYKGVPSPKVVGGDRISSDQPQNPGAYDAWAKANNVKSGEKTVEETKDLLPKY
jgi:streptogramin lyase